MDDSRVRLCSLLGSEETDRYLRIHAAHVAARRRGGDRVLGGIELHPPTRVTFLEGDFRPGLLALGRELAGDHLCWDLRRGRPSGDAPPVLVYCDHELGEARPFARDVGGALVHILLRDLVGTPGREAVPALERWLRDFAAVLGRRDQERLRRLRARAARLGQAPVFANERALAPAARDLLPPAGGGFDWCSLPPAWVPLLDPEDPAELTSAAARYRDAIATYRVMIDEEGRPGYAPHLALALRGLSEVCLRRRRFAAALEAAREAIGLYEPWHEAGDRRFVVPLLFVHRVAADVLGLRGQKAAALEHAQRALQVGETLHLDAADLLQAFDRLGEALERERAGESRYEVELRLTMARRGSQRFREGDPPHPYRASAERLERLARPAHRRRRPASRRPGSGGRLR